MAFWAQGRVDSEVRVAGHVGSRTCWVRIALWGHLVAGTVPSHDGNDLSDPQDSPVRLVLILSFKREGPRGRSGPGLPREKEWE